MKNLQVVFGASRLRCLFIIFTLLIVVITVIYDNKPANDKSQQKKKLKKEKDNLSNSKKKIIVKTSASILVLEGEDEDSFPISTTYRKSDESDVGNSTDKKMTAKKREKQATLWIIMQSRKEK